MTIKLCFMATSTYSGMTWEGNGDKQEIKAVFEELNVPFYASWQCLNSYDKNIEVIADLLGFTRKPASLIEKLVMRYQNYHPTNSKKVDELFQPTVDLLNKLGHQVYLGVDSLPSELKSYILSRDRIAESSGMDPCGARCTSLKNGKTFIFIREEYCKYLLWHEAWHTLQFSYDKEKLQYWMQEDRCPAIPDSFLQEGINAFFSKHSTFRLDDIQKELPALAVENHPEFVISLLESLL